MQASAVILHIPHASTAIPEPELPALALSGDDLCRELLRMTDWYTDELFRAKGARSLRFPVSRLVVDPERFPDDAEEPMACRGMGAVYTHTSDGRPLRPSLDAAERKRLLDTYYWPHHQALERMVRDLLARNGSALIIDAHSFASSPLPYEPDQTPDRPAIGIGTDEFHTPERLQQAAVCAFRKPGWRVEVNRPYCGTIVPQAFYRTDARVHSIMVEVNRALYLKEETGEKQPGFSDIARKVQTALRGLSLLPARFREK